jgi:hypothetical protein
MIVENRIQSIREFYTKSGERRRTVFRGRRTGYLFVFAYVGIPFQGPEVMKKNFSVPHGRKPRESNFLTPTVPVASFELAALPQ